MPNRLRLLRRTMICTLLIAAAVLPSMGAEKLPFIHPLFTDHMVLQRNMKAPVFGWTTPGAIVTVTLNGETSTATAGPDGYWKAALGPFPAGGPYTIAVDGPEKATIEDVLIGDVWLCSGQSNMEMGVGVTNNGAQEIAGANNPQIRLFSVPKVISGVPKRIVDAKWQRCTPETIGSGYWGGFSAAAYYFGREINRVEKVPVGLVQSAWSGTVAEAWVSAKSVSAIPEFSGYASQIERMSREPIDESGTREEQMERWYKESDPGIAAGWASPDLDDSGWKTMALPTEWGPTELAPFDGIVYFRYTFTLPDAWAGKDLELSLGPIDDIDTTWVNGTNVGGGEPWNAPRKYTVPAAVLRQGKNTITVRDFDIALGGGIYGDPSQMTLRPVGSSEKGISLAGDWRYRASMELKDAKILPPCCLENPNTATLIYNGMIAPLTPAAIKGAIWYQGEANVGRANQYTRLLPTLIRDWRKRFSGGQFPFLIVQLAGFGEDPTDLAEAVPWAELREAQYVISKHVPKTGLAVAIDIGDKYDIHPKNKQEVGRRLSLSAESIAYKQKGTIFSGPEFRKMKVEGSSATISFNHVHGGLVTPGANEIKGFQVAGADRKFFPADAMIQGNEIIVSSPKVAAPAVVRYAWENTPECNLYNEEGLPAIPFSTDGLTEKAER